MTDVSQLELVLRLVLGAAIGAGIGIEREVHGHPAGMRTHLLVALGSALFTVLSFHGFGSGGDIDPTRVAAQVVSGIGFLGAGAILKEGFTIRGLTTAASLWSTAALGMAAGVGEYVVAIAASAIVLVSLWPLRPVAERLEGSRRSETQLRLEVRRLDAISSVRTALRDAGVVITGSRSRRLESGAYEVELELRQPANGDVYATLAKLDESPEVVIAGVDQPE
jgi:putative Mg2+ transporter-C (MgtC) family protein